MLKIEHEARRIVALLANASPSDKALIFQRTVESCRMELTDTENGIVRDSYVLGRLAHHLEFDQPLKTVVDEVAQAAIEGRLIVGMDTWRAISKLALQQAGIAKAA